jgi:biopolymer transport protein ExbB/TolQ
VSDPTREMPPLSAEIVGAVLRASRRSAALVHEDMRQGLTGLATIAYLAPWCGLLATVLAIPNSFVGCGGEKSTCMAAVVVRLSWSIWPTAFGLLIGLMAAWGNRYLTSNLEVFDRAMEGAALDLVNQLSRYRGRWTFGPRPQ